MKVNKILRWGGVICIFLFGVSEIGLRLYGFGKMPLYYASDEYEYMSCPNQDGRRFGNHYHYNSYSQRSDEPDSTKRIILGLGDSVIYGGIRVDQDSLATSLFTKETGMQMLNISAGSWGPDNCAAYLNKFGTFNAKAIFLVVSSHDAHDIMDFQPVVGVHPSYPNKQYPLAIVEVWDRYVKPRIFKKKKMDPDQQVAQGIRKSGVGFNPGFDKLKAIAAEKNIPLFIYLHAEQSELQAGEYNDQGQEIIQWAIDNNVPLIRELDYHFTASDYQDAIHLNVSGQRKLADVMKETIRIN